MAVNEGQSLEENTFRYILYITTDTYMYIYYTIRSICIFPPHLCVGFLLLALHPPSSPPSPPSSYSHLSLSHLSHSDLSLITLAFFVALYYL